MDYIGVVRLDRVGDTILTLPAIKIIKQNYPSHKIVGIFNQYNSSLFIYNNKLIHPYFDIIEIIDIDLNYKKNFLNEFFGYLKVIFFKKYNKYFFDKLFVFSPTSVSYLLGSLMKAKKKYTYFYSSRFNKNIFKKYFIYYEDPVDKSLIDYEYYDVKHEIIQNLEIVKLDIDFSIGSIDNYIPELFLPDIEFPKYDLLVFDKELYFTSKEGVQWIEIFVQSLFNEVKGFYKTVNKSNFRIGFLSKRKQFFESFLKGEVISPDMIDLMGLVRNAKCVVCFDSGIVHIASAFNTNIVVIFTNRYFEFDIKRWAPLSEKNKILKLDLFNDEFIDYTLTNPSEFAKYVFFHAKEYIV